MPSAGRRALGGARCNYYWGSKRAFGGAAHAASRTLVPGTRSGGPGCGKRLEPERDRRWREAPSLLRGHGGRRAAEGRRGASARRRGEPPAMGAERPSHGGGRTGPCRPHRQAPGIVTERRRPRSGLRGAGRGEAAPGGIEPGDGSEGPGGRPTLPTDGADDGRPSSATMEDALPATGFGECPTRAATNGTVAASNAGSGRRKS